MFFIFIGGFFNFSFFDIFWYFFYFCIDFLLYFKYILGLIWFIIFMNWYLSFGYNLGRVSFLVVFLSLDVSGVFGICVILAMCSYMRFGLCFKIDDCSCLIC